MTLAQVNDPKEARLFFEEFKIPYEQVTRGENKGMLRVKPIRAIDRRNLMDMEERLKSEGLGYVIDHMNCFRDAEDRTVCTFSPYGVLEVRVPWLKGSKHSIYGGGTVTFATVVG